MSVLMMKDLIWQYASLWEAPGTNQASGMKFYFLGLAQHTSTGDEFLVRNWGAGHFDWQKRLCNSGQLKIERGSWNGMYRAEDERRRKGYDQIEKNSATMDMHSVTVTQKIRTLVMAGSSTSSTSAPDPEPEPVGVEMMTAAELLAEPVTTDVYAELIRRRAEAISEIDAQRVAIAELEELKHLFEMKIRG